MPDAAQNARDSATWPRDCVLNIRKRPTLVRRQGQGVEQLTHEIAAPVVEPPDLGWIVHSVVGHVLGVCGTSVNAGHVGTVRPLDLERLTQQARPAECSRARRTGRVADASAFRLVKNGAEARGLWFTPIGTPARSGSFGPSHQGRQRLGVGSRGEFDWINDGTPVGKGISAALWCLRTTQPSSCPRTGRDQDGRVDLEAALGEALGRSVLPTS